MRSLFAFLLLLTWQVQAQEYAVVVSVTSGVDAIDARLIRDVFLRKRHFADSVRLLPVNITGDVEVRRAFESTVLNMDREQLNQYWIESHFKGVSPPGTQASFASLKKLVERVDGAITYLPRNMLDGGLKVVYEF